MISAPDILKSAAQGLPHTELPHRETAAKEPKGADLRARRV
jgi:hypothetical protein